MTKRQQIEALLKEGKSRKEITAIINSSRNYVKNVARDLKKGLVTIAIKKYWKSDRGKVVKKRKLKIITDFHQKATMPRAKKRYQRWAKEDLEYLEEHGKKMSMHQLAVSLGRSYKAVQQAAFRWDIDLRGDKMGVNSGKFIGAYDNEQVV